MLLVVGLHGCLKGCERAVHLLINRNIHLCGCCPEHYHAVYARLLLEAADILADLLGHVPAVGALLHIVAVEALGIVLVERCLEGLDGFQFLLHRIDILFLEHLGIDGRLIGIGRIYVPGCEHDVVERRKRHDVLIMEIFLVGSAAYANLIVLGHRTDGLGQTFAGHKHAGHEG